MHEISVIVTTYNSDWNKLRVTLNSILLQKNIDFQIIISDDGSKTRWDEKIKELFSEFNFNNYIIANMEANGGTVKNVYNGLQYADGAYIKPISPGDYFYSETALSEWVEFMRANNSLFSFGDAVYYNNLLIPDDYKHTDAITADTNGQYNAGEISINIVDTVGAPAKKHLFNKSQDRKKVFENYLLANDTILGASIMAETNLYKKYIERIVGRLVYAEDYLARLLVFDGIEIDYFPGIVIWYEYGVGASSGVNEKWVALLHKDFEESNRIILESENCFDVLSKKYMDFLKESSGSGLMHKLKKCAAFPGLVTSRLDKNNCNMTPADADRSFLIKII